MKRTTAPNNQSNKYVDQTGSVPGTSLVAEDRNLIQEEICNLIESHGETLDGGNDHQLVDILGEGASPTFAGLTSTGAVNFNSNLIVSGTAKLNNYLQLRTPTSYSTGTLASGGTATLPIGWYSSTSTSFLAHGAFFCDATSPLMESQSGTILEIAGGLAYSDGFLLVKNISGSSTTFNYKKY